MSTLRVFFGRGRSLTSILVRHADRWGRASHCGIMTYENTVVEALGLEGVVETAFEEVLLRHRRVWILDFECSHPSVGIDWARSQIGCAYDWLAIFGNIFRQSWSDDGAWTCAELVAMALQMSGAPRFRETPWRISPNQLAMVI